MTLGDFPPPMEKQMHNSHLFTILLLPRAPALLWRADTEGWMWEQCSVSVLGQKELPLSDHILCVSFKVSVFQLCSHQQITHCF